MCENIFQNHSLQLGSPVGIGTFLSPKKVGNHGTGQGQDSTVLLQSLNLRTLYLQVPPIPASTQYSAPPLRTPPVAL